MRALQIYSGDISMNWLTSYTLRQGLEPVLDLSNPRPIQSSANSNSNQKIIYSPDKTKGIGYRQSNIAWYIPDSLTSDTATITTAYSGSISDAFCGNLYYGFVGDGTFLHVFDWATHSVLTLDKTGLGTVRNCTLHPDGTHLAIIHSTSPFVRVYNLAAGTYVNPAVAAPTLSYCCWTNDGNWLVLNSTTAATAILKYSKDLQTRVIISTFNGNIIDSQAYSRRQPQLEPHPTKPDCVISAPNTASSNLIYAKLIEINATTNTITDIIPRTTEFANANYYFDIDNVEGIIYVLSSLLNTNPALIIDLDTYQILPRVKTWGILYDKNPFSTTTSMGTIPELINHQYGIISGTVRDIDNNPAERVVRAFRRSDGLLMAQTTSDAVSGDYQIITPTQDPEGYDIQFMTADEEILNDLIYARATPQPL